MDDTVKYVDMEIDWESHWDNQPLPLFTGTGGNELEEEVKEVKAINIDKTYFKDSSSNSQGNDTNSSATSDFVQKMQATSFTDALLKSHKKKSRDSWYDQVKEEYEKYVEGLKVSKKRRF